MSTKFTRCYNFQRIHHYHIFRHKSLSSKHWPWQKISKGQPRVITWKNYEGIEFLMLHSKFSCNHFCRRIVKRFRRTGYTLDIMRQTPCLVFNAIMVDVVLTLCWLEWVFHVVLFSIAGFLLFVECCSGSTNGEERASFSAIVYMYM